MGPKVPIEMIEAARAGDPADVERLLAAVWADAYRLSRAIVIHPEHAEDAAQEACVIMFRSITCTQAKKIIGHEQPAIGPDLLRRSFRIA